MNLFEICDTFKISLHKARLMHKKGVLRIDEDMSDTLAETRHLLANGQPLTAMHLCELVENPGLILDLGKYAGRAEGNLGVIGNAKEQAAPKQVAAYISDAACGDREAVDILLPWLMEIIPSDPVPHSFIAVRLLLGLAPSVRKFDAPRIRKALLECRKREEFADWWYVSRIGTRNKTFYRRPAKKPVATFDL